MLVSVRKLIKVWLFGFWFCPVYVMEFFVDRNEQKIYWWLFSIAKGLLGWGITVILWMELAYLSIKADVEDSFSRFWVWLSEPYSQNFFHSSNALMYSLQQWSKIGHDILSWWNLFLLVFLIRHLLCSSVPFQFLKSLNWADPQCVASRVWS